MRIILRYDPPDLDEDIIDLFHVQDMQFDANSNEQVRNELVESYANMNLACRMIGSRSSHQAVHLKMIQRFQAQVEFVDNTLGSESTFKLNFDLVNNIFTIEPTNSNTWKFYQRNDVLTYVRNSDGSCYVERGNFHRILCTESIVELFRWMNPMSDFEFVGVETYRGRLVEVYQKVSTTQNEQEKVNRLYQTTIYLVAHQNDDETRYELVMIHEEAMDSETVTFFKIHHNQT